MFLRMRVGRPAFTLIELLIVVAIIAILAAVALPNFLEAQMRAKVTRTKSDMRTVATALEAYHVDYNHYPNMYQYRRVGTLTVYLFVPNSITTPVAYLSTKGILLDNFKPRRVNNRVQTGSTDPRFLDYYNYINSAQYNRYDFADATYPRIPREKYTGGWELWSYGPDLKVGPEETLNDGTKTYLLYDPTNGTVSGGDIRRTQKDTDGLVRDDS